MIRKNAPSPGQVITPKRPRGKMGGKMSASGESGKIALHESEESIVKKMGSAWCEAGKVDGNGVLALAKYILFPTTGKLAIERPEKFGGDIAFGSYDELETSFAEGKLHPADLKQGVGKALALLLKPIRERLEAKKTLIAEAY